MQKTAQLPFHLVAWGQRLVQHVNCHPFYDASANAINNHRHHRVNNNHHKANRSVNSSYPQESLGFTIFPINLSKLPPPSHQHSNDKHEKKNAKSSVENSAHPLSKRIADRDAYAICRPRGVVRYHGGPIQVTYIMRDVLSTLISAMSDHQRPHAYNGSNHDVLATNAASKTSATAAHTEDHATPSTSANLTPQNPHSPPHPLLELIYFTESDQIVHFDTTDTLDMLTAAVNDTTFFSGRRREKHVDSDPREYMGNLSIWRECGQQDVYYEVKWPNSATVHVHEIPNEETKSNSSARH